MYTIIFLCITEEVSTVAMYSAIYLLLHIVMETQTGVMTKYSSVRTKIIHIFP